MKRNTYTVILPALRFFNRHVFRHVHHSHLSYCKLMFNKMVAF